jgi:hypothetical protein
VTEHILLDRFGLEQGCRQNQETGKNRGDRIPVSDHYFRKNIQAAFFFTP